MSIDYLYIYIEQCYYITNSVEYMNKIHFVEIVALSYCERDSVDKGSQLLEVFCINYVLQNSMSIITILK